MWNLCYCLPLITTSQLKMNKTATATATKKTTITYDVQCCHDYLHNMIVQREISTIDRLLEWRVSNQVAGRQAARPVARQTKKVNGCWQLLTLLLLLLAILVCSWLTGMLSGQIQAEIASLLKSGIGRRSLLRLLISTTVAANYHKDDDADESYCSSSYCCCIQIEALV